MAELEAGLDFEEDQPPLDGGAVVAPLTEVRAELEQLGIARSHQALASADADLVAAEQAGSELGAELPPHVAFSALTGIQVALNARQPKPCQVLLNILFRSSSAFGGLNSTSHQLVNRD